MFIKKYMIPGFGNGKTKPVIPVEIDWDDPYSKYLYDVYIFDEQNGYKSLANETDITLTGSNVARHPEFITTAQTDGSIDLGTLPVNEWSGATFILSFSNVTGADVAGRALSIQYSGLDDIRLYRSTATLWVVAWDDGTILNQTVTTSGDAARKVFALSHSGSRQKTYYNGVLNNNNTNTYNFSGTGGVTKVGIYSGGTAEVSADYETLLIFKDGLTDEIIAELYDKPFRVLKPKIDSNWFVNIAGTTVEASVLFGITTNATNLSDAVANAQTANGLITQSVIAGDATADAVTNAGVVANVGLSADAVAEGNVTNSIIKNMSTTATVTAGGQIEASVSFATQLNVSKIADAVAEANLSAGVTLNATAIADAVAEASLTIGNTLGMVTTGQAITGAVVEAAITSGVVVNGTAVADATAEAGLIADAIVGCAIIAEAAAEAGLQVGHILDVVVDGTKISGGVITIPEGRMYTIVAENRIIDVSEEDRIIDV